MPLPNRASDPLASSATVCAEFDVSRRTLDRWVERGLLPPPHRIAGRAYWPRSALLELWDKATNLPLKRPGGPA